MTEREIDDLLAAWNSRLGAAAQNLVDLRAHSCYQRLLAKTDLTGLTADTVSPVLDSMGTLFEQYDLIRRSVAQAERLRGEIPGFFGGNSDQKVREIEFYLKGKCIRLAPAQIPAAQRSPGPVETAELVSAGELLGAMEEGFQKAQGTILAVDRAWNLLKQATADAEKELAELRQGGLMVNEVAAAQAALKPLLDKIEADPLGAQQDMDTKVRPVMIRVRTILDETKRDQQAIESGLSAAEAKLSEALRVHGEAAAAYADAVAKLTDCPGVAAPQPETSLDDLRAWLSRLEQKYHEGLLKPLLVGLSNWNKAAEALVSKDREAIAAAAAMLEQRTELRGRLDALKAKARARGFAENAALLEISQQARDLLYSRPTPMRKAADLVAQYEGLLNGPKGTT